MLIPDVLALPLAEAIARLEAAEIGYTVAATQPPRRQNEVVAEKIAVEYVVRQSLYQSNLLNGQAYARTIDGARNAIGSFASSSKVTYSQASCFARTACSSLLFNA